MKSLIVLLIFFWFNHNLSGSETSSLIEEGTSSSLRYTFNGQPFEDLITTKPSDGTYSLNIFSDGNYHLLFIPKPTLKLVPMPMQNILSIDVQDTDLSYGLNEPVNPYFEGFEQVAINRITMRDKFKVEMQKFEEEAEQKLKQERKPLSQLNVNEDTSKAESHLSKKIKTDNNSFERQRSDHEINGRFSLFGDGRNNISVQGFVSNLTFITLLFQDYMIFRAPEESPAYLREIIFRKLPNCNYPMVLGIIDFSVQWPNLKSFDNFHHFLVIGTSIELVFRFPKQLKKAPPLACEEELDDEDEKGAASVQEESDNSLKLNTS